MSLLKSVQPALTIVLKPLLVCQRSRQKRNTQASQTISSKRQNAQIDQNKEGAEKADKLKINEHNFTMLRLPEQYKVTRNDWMTKIDILTKILWPCLDPKHFYSLANLQSDTACNINTNTSNVSACEHVSQSMQLREHLIKENKMTHESFEKLFNQIRALENDVVCLNGFLYQTFCFEHESPSVKKALFKLKNLIEERRRKKNHEMTHNEVQSFFNACLTLNFEMTSVSIIFDLIFNLVLYSVFDNPAGQLLTDVNAPSPTIEGFAFDGDDVRTHAFNMCLKKYLLVPNAFVWTNFYYDVFNLRPTQMLGKDDISAKKTKIVNFILRTFPALKAATPAQIKKISSNNKGDCFIGNDGFNRDLNPTNILFDKLFAPCNDELRIDIEAFFAGKIAEYLESRKIKINLNLDFLGVYPHVLLLNKDEFHVKYNLLLFSIEHHLKCIPNEKKLTVSIKKMLARYLTRVVDSPLLHNTANTFRADIETILKATKTLLELVV